MQAKLAYNSVVHSSTGRRYLLFFICRFHGIFLVSLSQSLGMCVAAKNMVEYMQKGETEVRIIQCQV